MPGSSKSPTAETIKHEARNYIKYSVISSRRRNSSENFANFFFASFHSCASTGRKVFFSRFKTNAKNERKTFRFLKTKKRKTFAKDFRWNFSFSLFFCAHLVRRQLLILIVSSGVKQVGGSGTGVSQEELFFLCDEQKVSSSCGFACSKIDSALEIRFCELNAVFVPCSS